MNSIKKIIFATMIVLAMNGMATAQTDSLQTAKSKSRIGYYHSVGVDYVLCPGAIEYDNHKYYDMGIRLHVLNGIQFNPWLTLSLDFQFAYTHYHEEEWTFPVPMKGLSNGIKGAFHHYEDFGFKLGLDFRYRLLNRFRWSPIIGITGGPSIEFNSYPEGDGYSRGWGFGGYLSEYYGCSYRYLNNKQLWFGVGWGMDFGYVDLLEPLLSFRFEIQL